MLSRYTNAHGQKKVVGGPGLKQTQIYTAEFGRAMASWWMVHGPTSTGTAGVSTQSELVNYISYFQK